MSIELEEVGPNRWRVRKDRQLAPVSDLPRPYVISDTMDPTEQVDGKFYTSKRAFRATGRALGLTEVGNEKIKPKPKNAGSKAATAARREAIKLAAQKVRAGVRT